MADSYICFSSVGVDVDETLKHWEHARDLFRLAVSYTKGLGVIRSLCIVVQFDLQEKVNKSQKRCTHGLISTHLHCTDSSEQKFFLVRSKSQFQFSFKWLIRTVQKHRKCQENPFDVLRRSHELSGRNQVRGVLGDPGC